MLVKMKISISWSAHRLLIALHPSFSLQLMHRFLAHPSKSMIYHEVFIIIFCKKALLVLITFVYDEQEGINKALVMALFIFCLLFSPFYQIVN